MRSTSTPDEQVKAGEQLLHHGRAAEPEAEQPELEAHLLGTPPIIKQDS